MRLANKGISSFNRGRIRAEGQGLVLPALHDAPPTSHLSSTLIIIHYSISFLIRMQRSQVCVMVSFAKEGSSIRMLRDISGSLCFHQPDCFACRGFTKVFSPLISLIRGRAAEGGR